MAMSAWCRLFPRLFSHWSLLTVKHFPGAGLDLYRTVPFQCSESVTFDADPVVPTFKYPFLFAYITTVFNAYRAY
jgi:hypothetical protein